MPAIPVDGEIWKPVVGFGSDLYEVSSLGRVRRVVGLRGQRLQTPTLVLGKPHKDKGYIIVSITVGGKSKSRKVHHLVLDAFVGLRPEGTEADHEDTNRTNNRISNLRWITHAQNIQHKVNMGNAQMKIVPDKIVAISAEPMSRSNVDVAKQYKIHHSTVARIRNRQTRKEVA